MALPPLRESATRPGAPRSGGSAVSYYGFADVDALEAAWLASVRAGAK